jgi:DNA-binding NarL/FixJ family response regulator
VLVVEDHPVFRDGLVALLTSLPDIDVVAAVADGRSAVDRAAQGGVDVVLMDLNLPDVSGVAATAAITAQPEPPAVLVVTMVDDDDTVVAAMQAGARGYLLKGSTGDEIAAAVVTVAAGGAVFGAGVARQLLAAAAASAQPSASMPTTEPLTDREAQVLSLLAEGRSNAQIARSLGLTLKTVQNYVSRVLDKLQVNDRTQAALLAQRRRGSTSGTRGTA